MKARRIITLALVLVMALGTAAGASTLRQHHEDSRWPQRGHYTAQSADVVGEWTLRLHGSNRFETAAAISQLTYPDDALPYVVFLASGENYPDALALGPSTFSEGPLLLTRKGALPDETRNELARLNPCLIVAVGGKGAIADSVLADADGYTAASDDPTCE